MINSLPLALGLLLFSFLITSILVVPFIDEITAEDVEEALELMEQRKLIKRYEDDTARPLIQVLDWWEWQKGLRYWSPSHYQAPQGWEDKVIPRDEAGRFAKD